METNELKIFWLRLWEKHPQNIKNDDVIREQEFFKIESKEHVKIENTNFAYRLILKNTLIKYK